MSERDPRVDPKPGDVLRKGKCERVILFFDELGGVPFQSIWHGKYASQRNRRSHVNFRKWAAEAEVVHRQAEAGGQ